MTEAEAYEAGLEILGFCCCDPEEDYDLRTDPAFAWKVLEAIWAIYQDDSKQQFWIGIEIFFRRLVHGTPGSFAHHLHSFVITLGKEHADDT